MYKKDKHMQPVKIKIGHVTDLTSVLNIPNSYVLSCRSVVCKNVLFSINDIVLLAKKPPLFGVITNIYVYDSLKILRVNVRPAGYDATSNSFKLSISTESRFVFIENLAFFKPLPSVSIGTFTHVISKYCNLLPD